jgi:hypothetical protein
VVGSYEHPNEPLISIKYRKIFNLLRKDSLFLGLDNGNTAFLHKYRAESVQQAPIDPILRDKAVTVLNGKV